jgi:hypothetical protein
MLYNLKAALALICLFVLMVDALPTSAIRGLMKKRREMVSRKRDLPLSKRDIDAQTITVRFELSDSPRDPW